MHLALWLLSVAILWYKRTTSLLKLILDRFANANRQRVMNLRWALAQSRGDGHRSLVTPKRVLSEYNEERVLSEYNEDLILIFVSINLNINTHTLLIGISNSNFTFRAFWGLLIGASNQFLGLQFSGSGLKSRPVYNSGSRMRLFYRKIVSTVFLLIC